MADDIENTEVVAPAVTDTPDVQASDSPAPTPPNSDGGIPAEVKRALSKANKEAETLRLKLKEFEDRDKSEAEKLAERATAAEKRVQELETRGMRLEVASEKGLTAGQAKRLMGSTREELEADADDLLATFKAAVPAAPRPDPSQGARPTSAEALADAEFEKYYPSTNR